MTSRPVAPPDDRYHDRGQQEQKPVGSSEGGQRRKGAHGRNPASSPVSPQASDQYPAYKQEVEESGFQAGAGPGQKRSVGQDSDHDEEHE